MWDLTNYTSIELLGILSMTEGEISDTFSITVDRDFWLELRYELRNRGIDIDNEIESGMIYRVLLDLNPSRRDAI